MKTRSICLVHIFDLFLSAFALAAAIFIKYDLKPPANEWKVFLVATTIMCVAYTLAVYFLHLYRVLWQFAGAGDALRLAICTLIAAMAAYIGCDLLASHFGTPEPSGSITFLSYVFMTAMIAFLRLAIRIIYRQRRAAKSDNGKSFGFGRVMMIGAGEAANRLIHDLKTNPAFRGVKIICAIDDDPAKMNTYIYGVRVVGNRDHILEEVVKNRIDTIILAIASVSTLEKSKLLEICSATGKTVKVLPPLDQLGDGEVNIQSVRDVQIEDLLGREPIKINLKEVMGYVSGKTVMVTGGGGSIGSELCRQIATYSPKKLIIFDIYENNAYDIQMELSRKHPDLDLTVLIGSVRDEERLDSVFDKYRPESVYHAAAHKHVPLMEVSPNEAIKNNVFGTLNTVKMADKYGVRRFVMISTDKAVNPTNVMGATKRLCEMIIQTYNNRSKTEFVAVRFGNVLGSNGSVIPLFKKQIAEGGPVRVTHPDIIRYFMTIPEAVSLVLEAGAKAKGGEIFVLDMGQPVKILTLAENLIRLSGFRPYTDIKIEFTGLRPGEKLFEELLMSEEGLRATENKLIHVGHPICIDEEKLFSGLLELHDVMEDDNCDIRSYIKKLVPTYIAPEDKQPELQGIANRNQ